MPAVGVIFKDCIDLVTLAKFEWKLKKLSIFQAKVLAKTA